MANVFWYQKVVILTTWVRSGQTNCYCKVLRELTVSIKEKEAGSGAVGFSSFTTKQETRLQLKLKPN